MIVLWCVVGLETLLQMATGLGMFLRAFGNTKSIGKAGKCALLLLLACIWLLGTYNATMCLFSILTVWVHVILDSIWLWGWSGKKLKAVLPWCVFYRWLFIVTKTPVLIVSGLMQDKTVDRVINHQSIYTAIIELFITFCLWWWCRHYGKIYARFVKATLERYGYLFLALGAGEYLGVSYLIDLLHVEFETYSLVMMGVMMLMFMAVLVIIFLYYQYRWNEKEKQILSSKAQILEHNYATIRQEQEENRKTIHDHRHELDYLYHCLLEKDYERARAYIERKNREYLDRRNAEVWTGNSGIDYLINKAWNRAEEKKIRFEVAVDMMESPIAEYDFFIILENILENAVEAAEKCEAGKRFIQLELGMKNDMFMLYQKNSYEGRPVERNGRLVTSKEDGHMHGWGIRIIQEIVEQYEGTLSIEYENFTFTLQITFGV